ncbi:hypothetical protein [Pilimelia anulata]|uniref:hypothetical protein n=1 Tax=Pilimelia anulata TaxID=53371 RepID=UPI001666773A|nr:hypothetical protein [Pilimelia anulata]
MSAAIGTRTDDQLRWFATATDSSQPRSMSDLQWARPDTADAVGAMLLAENAASINYRYPNDEPERPTGYRWTRVPVPGPLVVLKAIDCFDYQACEHPGRETSQAWRFCDALRRKMIRQLPGYSAADGWEYTGTTVGSQR